MNHHWKTAIRDITPNGTHTRTEKILRNILNCEIKILKNRCAIAYSKWCLEHHITPNFARWRNSNFRNNNNVETKIVRENIKEKNTLYKYLKSDLHNHFQSLSTVISQDEITIITSRLNKHKTIISGFLDKNID